MAVDDIEFSIKGLDSLLGKFESVTEDVKRKGGRASLRKAAQMVQEFARQGALKINDPITSENIADNIAVRWSSKYNKATGNLGFRVGVLGGAASYANSAENRRKGRARETYITEGSKGNPGGNTWYWRLLEFGTSKMPAQPFMRKALSEHIEQVTSEFITQYERSMDRAIKRAKKKAAQGV